MHSCGARKAIYLNSFLNVMLLILRYLATSRSKNLVSRYFVSFCNLDCAANQIILGYRFSKIVLTLFESAHQKLNFEQYWIIFLYNNFYSCIYDCAPAHIGPFCIFRSNTIMQDYIYHYTHKVYWNKIYEPNREHSKTSNEKINRIYMDFKTSWVIDRANC